MRPAQTNEKFASLQYETDREAFIRGMAEKMTKYTTGANFNPHDGQGEGAGGDVRQPGRAREHGQRLLAAHGKTKDDCTRKLRFSAWSSAKTPLASAGDGPSDRDSYSNKRLHGPGICYPKLFKTLFHSMIILPAINGYRKLFKIRRGRTSRPLPTASGRRSTASFRSRTSRRALVGHHVVQQDDRESATRSRTASPKLLERKNDLNVKCLLRSVTTHGISNASKQTERADKVRRVQSTQLGYTCPAHSADSGEKVGINRNMAVTAKVTSAENSLIFKELLQDADVIALDNISSEDMYRNKMALVYINGELVGCLQAPPTWSLTATAAFVAKVAWWTSTRPLRGTSARTRLSSGWTPDASSALC